MCADDGVAPAQGFPEQVADLPASRLPSPAPAAYDVYQQRDKRHRAGCAYTQAQQTPGWHTPKQGTAEDDPAGDADRQPISVDSNRSGPTRPLQRSCLSQLRAERGQLGENTILSLHALDDFLASARECCANRLQQQQQQQQQGDEPDMDLMAVSVDSRSFGSAAPRQAAVAEPLSYAPATPKLPAREPGFYDRSFEERWGGWADSLVDDMLETMSRSPSTTSASEYGGAAGPQQDVSGTLLSSWPASPPPETRADLLSSYAAPGPSNGVTSSPGAGSSREDVLHSPRKPAPARLQQGTTGTTDRQQATQQRWFSQRFVDAALEQEFRLWQGRLLRSVDIVASLTVLLAAIATGFYPAPLAHNAPWTWPLVLLPHGGRALLGLRMAPRRYVQHREVIAACCSVFTLLHGLLVLTPGFVPYLPSERLTHPFLFIRLIGGEMTAFLGFFYRVRFAVWLPLQLLCGLLAIAALPVVAAQVAAAGAASFAWIMLAGAAYHLTLGIAAPGAFLWEMERRERASFAQQQLRQVAEIVTDVKAKAA